MIHNMDISKFLFSDKGQMVFILLVLGCTTWAFIGGTILSIYGFFIVEDQNKAAFYINIGYAELVFAVGAYITIYLSMFFRHPVENKINNLGDIATRIMNLIENNSPTFTNLNQNTQQIITQIKQLEESQKALADQIQSLQDRIPAAEPSEPHEEENQVKG